MAGADVRYPTIRVRNEATGAIIKVSIIDEPAHQFCYDVEARSPYVDTTGHPTWVDDEPTQEELIGVLRLLTRATTMITGLSHEVDVDSAGAVVQWWH